MLILWDIDGTLLSSEGAGAQGMELAGQEVFGAAFSLEGIELGGRLDPLIVTDALARMGDIELEPVHATFRATFHGTLKQVLEGDHPLRILPGAGELLRALDDMAGVTQALVTGNYQETAELKLRAADIDPSMFAFGVYGDDGQVRNDLPPKALDRARVHLGDEPEAVILVGDTPHDVTSGKAAGCHVLAVCTGSHDADVLEAAGADLVIDDLSEVEAVLAWMGIVRETWNHS